MDYQGYSSASVNPEIAALAPPNSGFRNIKPLTRAERGAQKDKVALEKARLMNRAGHQAKIYRENAPVEGVGLLGLPPDAAGFISDADRFHSDTSGEELLRRQAEQARKVEFYEKRRAKNIDREEERWQKIKDDKIADEEKWNRMREMEVKSKKNKSAVPYNAITLQYNDGHDGERLRQEDQRTRDRAHMRQQNMARHGDTRCGYNILTGEARSETSSRAGSASRRHLQSAGREAVVPYSSGYK
uniref:Uncharacterized protein n=1 Tax=Fibrocapsa japonica TaxID=94617 RepID=A0A7S2XXX1_9STRA|mmetsp:Transcript_2118/g.3101  ORF Transcript_2118/g.3101 Transcript_2118/m.3101 type:complete len:244 (+) Transcript_2118:115-846(+)|eukprot:CAMPEP_0113942518 /NCGR_PEP_ID=MMETSP1339-20121228/8224_1 /TAXON_ID=94617 /ORGANISM="Fibrocapsa japonica" /LENGTH=243 /DNA_ID=CAMNT_0000947031 /DNA_START=21 /DNA_END=752 /DNA_ORIENTATION=- /assembly_acc=CAM_ASM_000762